MFQQIPQAFTNSSVNNLQKLPSSFASFNGMNKAFNQQSLPQFPSNYPTHLRNPSTGNGVGAVSSAGTMHRAEVGSANANGGSNSNTSSTTNGKRKRSWSRAVFSNLQRKGLERQFEHQKYITKPDRKKLAARLGLKDAQVSHLFFISKDGKTK